MKLLIDMNLSPQWVSVFEAEGWSAIHWSTIGDPRAEDQEIMRWARENAYVVFTHDLDFGILLASTRSLGPSVIQIRTQDVMPERLGGVLVSVLRQYVQSLEEGALMTIDENKSRIRILPI